jgi:hypothetical protein
VFHPCWECNREIGGQVTRVHSKLVRLASFKSAVGRNNFLGTTCTKRDGVGGDFDCSAARNGLLVLGEKTGESAGAVTVPAQAAYIDLK